jgi:hypothetical protein
MHEACDKMCTAFMLCMFPSFVHPLVQLACCGRYNPGPQHASTALRAAQLLVQCCVTPTSHRTDLHHACFAGSHHAGTTAGQDLNLSLDRVNSNRNFTNKLWNAGKFILFQLEGVSDAEWKQLSSADFSSSSSSWQGLSLSDRWVLSSLHQVRCCAAGSVPHKVYWFLPMCCCLTSSAAATGLACRGCCVGVCCVQHMVVCCATQTAALPGCLVLDNAATVVHVAAFWASTRRLTRHLVLCVCSWST